ncbi:DedA family protein [Kineococcus rhizosphaerae]|uniref:Membrane-associated protein n=1 Tax=Kineococcus rhizosphaerae TaxID=559628 RepID=A0A2T0R6K9_9ACTN|nr:DedA family protein [Kineococcus rhizosphaerae]PRY16812.1 membrane-associated protein [Kineococcus rhizosphaerae]
MSFLAEFSAALTSSAPSAVPALLPDWASPETFLDSLGAAALWVSIAIVFVECGLFMFFLPGDSLLFTVGLFTHSGILKDPLWVSCLLLSVAAFLGNAAGYEIGRKAGPALFDRPNSKILTPKRIKQTREFFEKYGARAIILARFVPVVRTFITLAAGAGAMPRRVFLTFSAIGAVAWASGITLLGYALGSVSLIRDNLELGLLLLVVLSLIPVGIEYLRGRAKERKQAAVEPQTPERQH